MSFPILFPLIFASSAFVPVVVHARLAAGLRHLPAGERDGHRLPGPHDRGGPTAQRWVIQSLAWSVGLLIVLIPLAVRRYRTRT